MRLALKIISIIGIVLGVLALINGVAEGDGVCFLGGMIYTGWGIVALLYIKEVDKKKDKIN